MWSRSSEGSQAGALCLLPLVQGGVRQHAGQPLAPGGLVGDQHGGHEEHPVIHVQWGGASGA